MLCQSLTAAVFAAAVVWSTVPVSAEISTVHHRTVVQHVYTYEPAPAPYYRPGYAPPYAPVTSVPAAAVCLAFSLIGAC
jgi:hypothetical protein